jgi:hypothetical protein
MSERIAGMVFMNSFKPIAGKTYIFAIKSDKHGN